MVEDSLVGDSLQKTDMFSFLVFLTWPNCKYFKCQRGGRRMPHTDLQGIRANSITEASIWDEDRGIAFGNTHFLSLQIYKIKTCATKHKK
jgi:hypothetical protein